MKKTLVTLALAAVASTAFAHTDFYTFQDDASSANLYVSGYGRLAYDSVTETKTALNDKNQFVTQSKTTKTKPVFRFRLNFGGKFTDANKLTYGFHTRVQYDQLTTKTKTKFKDGKVVNPVEKSTKSESKPLALKQAKVFVSSPEYGTLTFGKMASVLDNQFGSDAVLLGNYKTAIGAETEFDRVVAYKSAKLADLVTLGASYARNYETADGRKKQLALQAEFDVAGNNVSAIYAATTDKKLKSRTAKAHSFDLNVSNSSLVEGLDLAADFAYEKTRTYGDYEVQTNKSHAHSFGVKAGYTVNQYFKPYAGYAYLSEKSEELQKTDPAVTSTHTHSLYVGFGSDLYQYKTVNVSSFVEFGYSKVKESKYAKKTHKTSSVNKTKTKEFDLGVKVSY